MCAELRPRPGHCHHEHIPPAAVRLKSHRISDATSSSRMSSGPFASTWAAGPFRQSTRPSSESIRAASGILRIDQPNQRHGWNFADAARCRRNADNNRCADSMIAFPAIKIGKNYEFHRIHTDGGHTKHTHTPSRTSTNHDRIDSPIGIFGCLPVFCYHRPTLSEMNYRRLYPAHVWDLQHLERPTMDKMKRKELIKSHSTWLCSVQICVSTYRLRQ